MFASCAMRCRCAGVGERRGRLRLQHIRLPPSVSRQPTRGGSVCACSLRTPAGIVWPSLPHSAPHHCRPPGEYGAAHEQRCRRASDVRQQMPVRCESRRPVRGESRRSVRCESGRPRRGLKREEGNRRDEDRERDG
ncbi:hypothetical protein B0H10DRAFT_2057040 [Mycena sp. CBHHK59/15]|nr:hypothetical protein B0H10DRAFT_2057040 [Mycena sp. CBHHK59/15]